MSLVSSETLTERIRHLETTEFLEIGTAPPVHFAAEGTMYWDRTSDDLYVNRDSANGWELIGGGGGLASPHNLLSWTHTDTLPATVQRGDLAVGQIGAEPGGHSPGGATYYISMTGDDALAGTTDATAWRTTANVNTLFSNGQLGPGDQILFKRGDHFALANGIHLVGSSGLVDAPIVIGAYGTGPRPALQGAAALRVIGRNNGQATANYITIENLEIYGVGGRAAVKLHDCQGIVLNNLYIHDITTSGGIWCAAIQVRYDSTVTMQCIEIADVAGEGIYVGIASEDDNSTITLWYATIRDTNNNGIDLKADTRDCDIRYVYLHDAGTVENSAIMVGGQGHTIHDCWIDGGNRGIYLGTYLAFAQSGFYNTVENVLFVNTGDEGVKLHGDGNTVRNCTFAGCPTGVDAGTMFRIPTPSQTIENCLFYNCGTDIYFRNNPANFTTANNWTPGAADFENLVTYDLLPGSVYTGYGWLPDPDTDEWVSEWDCESFAVEEDGPPVQVVTWQRLEIGAAGEYFYSDGIDADWAGLHFEDGASCTPTIIEPDDTAAVGAIAAPSRCDHRHGIVCAVPVDIANANAEGTATAFARSDHVHNHPAGLGVNLHHNEVHVVNSAGPHAEAGLTIGHVLRASGAAAFSFAAIQAGDLPGLGAVPALTFGLVNAAGAAATYVQTDASLAIFDAVVPGTIQCDDAAATGAAAFSARRDHQHAIVCAAPAANLSVSTTNAEGGATSFARSNHSHAITSSSNPGAAARILATNASGYLQLVGLGIGTAATAASSITVADDAWIGLGAAAGRIVFDNQAIDEICFEDCFVGINDLTPTTWLEITDYVTAYPCLCLGAAGNGEIATPDTEALRFGHWNAGTTTFTNRFHMTPSALIFAAGFDIHLPSTSFIGTDAAGARLRFNSAGATNYAYFTDCNVGVDATAPAVPLVVNSGNTNAFQISYAAVGWAATDGFTIAHAAGDIYLNQRENADMRFWVNGGERLTLLAGGNVGVNDSAPSARFEVNGDASDDPLTILDAASDNDSAFVNYIGVSAANWTRSLTSENDPSAYTLVGGIRIQINGTDYWLKHFTPT